MDDTEDGRTAPIGNTSATGSATREGSATGAGAESRDSPVTIAKYERHLEHDTVTPRDVAEAWRFSLAAFEKDPKKRELCLDYFERLVEHLSEKDSGFRRETWPDGSVVTLHKGALDVFPSPLPPTSRSGRAETILFGCLRQSRQASEYLVGTARRNCASTTFEVSSLCCDSLYTLRQAPASEHSEQAADEALGHAESEMCRIHQYYLESAPRRAQVRYASGMLIGAAIIYVIVAGIWAFFGDREELSLPLGVIAAGCTGAVVSVMQRMTRSALDVDYSMGRTVRFLGVFRPVIGGIFALGVFWMLRAGLVPHLDVPAGETGDSFFLAVGFVTGFSERLAQDMISTTERRMGPPPERDDIPEP